MKSSHKILIGLFIAVNLFALMAVLLFESGFRLQTPVKALPGPTSVPPIPTAAPYHPITFAIIGDFGKAGRKLEKVTELIKSWNPEFIVTVGDNNYNLGEAETIDKNIGQYFHSYIYPYTGSYGPGAETNNFYPVLGNHDWKTTNAQPYLDYFTLPGNERYYDFVSGPIHFFALDSDEAEPDGRSSDSVQADWLRQKLAASTMPWKIVFFHHPPYSSGEHGPEQDMQWPFCQWGATTVITGHDHTYERIVMEGFPYFVNGLGGGEIYQIETLVPGSEKRYNADYGAMLVHANDQRIEFKFIDINSSVIDVYSIDRDTLYDCRDNP